MADIVSLRQVTKQYPGTARPALDGVDLTIEDGAFVCVMGQSGLGKSTLLSILGAMSAPTSGQMIVDGLDVGGLGAEGRAVFRREYLGFVFQHLQLVPYLTALENVSLPLAPVSGRRAAKRDLASECLARVGLAGKEKSLPAHLSGGEQQRVAIARALVNRPPIILADEPIGNLDTENGDQIIGLLRKVNGEGHTIVMVTHNPAYAGAASRLVTLRDGRIVAGASH